MTNFIRCGYSHYFGQISFWANLNSFQQVNDELLLHNSTDMDYTLYPKKEDKIIFFCAINFIFISGFETVYDACSLFAH